MSPTLLKIKVLHDAIEEPFLSKWSHKEPLTEWFFMEPKMVLLWYCCQEPFKHLFFFFFKECSSISKLVYSSLYGTLDKPRLWKEAVSPWKWGRHEDVRPGFVWTRHADLPGWKQIQLPRSQWTDPSGSARSTKTIIQLKFHNYFVVSFSLFLPA